MPSINSARYTQRIIQTEIHESPSFLRKVHRLDPPLSDSSHALGLHTHLDELITGTSGHATAVEVIRDIVNEITVFGGYRLCYKHRATQSIHSK